MQKFPRLEETQRKVLSGFSSDVALGVHYCTSWITRTERASEDCDAEHRRSPVSTKTNASATLPRTSIPPVIHPNRRAPPIAPDPASPPPDVPGRCQAPQSIVMHFRGADLTVSNEVDTSDMSWPCLCRYSYAPVFAECDTGPVFTASSTQTHTRGTSVTTDRHKGRTGSTGRTGSKDHKGHTGIDRRHRPAHNTAFNGTAHTHTHTHTHTARANRIDSPIGTDSFAGTGSLRASPRRGHNGTHHRINPRHPRHDAGERLCRRPCQPVVNPLYKRPCQYAGAPAQMPGTPLSLSYTLHEKDDAAHPMDNTTKQMCAAARPMDAAAGPMYAAAGPMYAAARPMRAAAGQVGATAKASQDPRRRSAGAECGAGA